MDEQQRRRADRIMGAMPYAASLLPFRGIETLDDLLDTLDKLRERLMVVANDQQRREDQTEATARMIAQSGRLLAALVDTLPADHGDALLARLANQAQQHRTPPPPAKPVQGRCLHATLVEQRGDQWWHPGSETRCDDPEPYVPNDDRPIRFYGPRPYDGVHAGHGRGLADEQNRETD